MPEKSKTDNQRSDVKSRTDIRSHQKMHATMALLDINLTGAAYKVAVYLINLHNNEYGYAWPTFKQIMEKCRLRRETVNEALKLLRSRGIIMSKTKGNNRYYIAWDSLLSPTATSDAEQDSSASVADGEYRKPALSAVPETGTKGVRKPARYTDYDPDYQHSLQKKGGSAAAAGGSFAEGEGDLPSRHLDVASPKQWPEDGFQRLCEIHPPTMKDQQFAKQKYYKAREDFGLRVPFKKVETTLRRYVTSNDPEFTAKLGVWLLREQWEDEPVVSKTDGLTLHARARMMTKASI